MREFLRRRIVQPIIDLLKQGITPEKIALSLAFGICLGVFPVLGSTTILCLAAAFLFRLNIPAIQLVNYLIYPVQIVLIMPFIRLGERIVGARPIPFSLSQMIGMTRQSVSREVKGLEREGLIDVVYGGVVLKAPQDLARIAASEGRDD